jgi:hypothetical protein
MARFPANVVRMVREGIDVLINRQPRIFYAYSSRASDSDSLTYIATVAILMLLVDMLLSGFGGGAVNFLSRFVNELFGFYIFAILSFYIAKQRGGIGDQEQLVYTFALFYIPIRVLFWLISWLFVIRPFAVGLPLGLIMTVLEAVLLIYYGQLAIQGVMAIRDRREGWVVVGAALMTIFVIRALFSGGAFM